MTAGMDDTAGQGASSAGRAIAWWAEGLSRLIDRDGRLAPPWRVMLMKSGARIEAFTRKGRSVQSAGVFDPLSDAADTLKLTRRLAREAGGPRAIVLRLAPAEIIHARLQLPTGVREVLPLVLRNQLESHAPWPADQALFAYREASGGGDAGRLDLDLWITGKARTTALVGQLGRLGLAPGIIDFGDDPGPEPMVDLTSARQELLARRRRGIARLLVSGLVVGGLAVAGAVGWMVWREQALASIERDVAAARRTANAAALARGGSELEQVRRTVIAEKTRAASMAVVIEAVSRALPDEAYLERVEVRDGRITLVGKATNAPALVEPLEASAHLSEVQFTAPTTRQAGETRESFTLSARIVPRSRID